MTNQKSSSNSVDMQSLKFLSCLIAAVIIIGFAVLLERLLPAPNLVTLKINHHAWHNYVIQELAKQKLIESPDVDALQRAFRREPKKISMQIADIHALNRKTLLPVSAPPYHLNYELKDGVFGFSTIAEYGYSKPVCAVKPHTKLDFKIAAAVNFGLRGFIFSDQYCDEWEVGDYNTAYFDVAVSKDQRLLAFSVRGHYRIELYSLPDRRKLYDIDGYAASSLAFWKGDLYFAAARRGQGDTASLYQYSVSDRRVKGVFFRNALADARGIAFRDDQLGAISDGLSSRLILFDPSNQFTATHILQGLNYPNAVSFDAEGNLLVADEHHGLVRNISMSDFSELWHSPAGQLNSPASAIEIPKGQYRGHYLIADADGNRLLLVEPKSWDVVFEAGNIPSVMGAVPIFEE